jgi:hypothetical protein
MMEPNSTPTQEASAHPSPVEEAGAVADRVEIRNVRLLSSRCQQPGAAPPAGVGFAVKLSHVTRTQVNEVDRVITVLAAFRFLAGPANAPDVAPVISVAAEFQLTYSVTDLTGLTETQFRRFGELNGIYNAWPYWREFLQSTTSRMGLAPFTLPVFRVPRSAPKTAAAGTRLQAPESIQDTHAAPKS